VDGSFIHNGGTLQETRTVGAGSTVNFLKIRDRGNTTDKYRGVDLTTSSSSDLGSTTVSVRAVDTAAGEYCTNSGAGSNNLPARVTLWALTSQVPGSVTNPSVYRYTSGAWQEVSNIATGTSGSYTWAAGNTPRFSAFLIAQAGTSPTAVTLETFQAHARRTGSAWPLAGARIALLGGASIVLKRKRQQ